MRNQDPFSPLFAHWFQNCAQLNQSIRANIPGFSLAVCQLLESYQPMRKQDALDIMLRFNLRQFWNQLTKYIMTLRNQLENFFVWTPPEKIRGIAISQPASNTKCSKRDSILEGRGTMLQKQLDQQRWHNISINQWEFLSSSYPCFVLT